MKNKIIKINKKITDDDRMNIQAGIKQKLSGSKIAKIIGKNRSSIYREIVNNAVYKEAEQICANCKHINECKLKLSFNQYFTCSRFQYMECEIWKKFPYTCNCCTKCQSCWKLKRYYNWSEANKQAEFNKSEPRKHYKINGDDLLKLDSIVSKLVKNKNSVHDIWAGNKWLKTVCCEDTIRNYIYSDRLTCKKHQLPFYGRYPRTYKDEYNYPKDKIQNSERILGRTFAFYLKYVYAHKSFWIWEYDSVEGKRTDKIDILTIMLKKYRFQFGYIIRKHNPLDVLNIMRHLQNVFGDKFKDMFQINLSDNGTEFNYFHKAEVNDDTGEVLCKVFFTNTYKATDKATCERNHRLIRFFIPKGKSLDGLTQSQLKFIFSNINSKPRKVLKNRTPYECVLKDPAFSQEFLDKIEIDFVSPEDLNFCEIEIKKSK